MPCIKKRIAIRKLLGTRSSCQLHYYTKQEHIRAAAAAATTPFYIIIQERKVVVCYFGPPIFFSLSGRGSTLLMLCRKWCIIPHYDCATIIGDEWVPAASKVYNIIIHVTSCFDRIKVDI